VLPTFLLTIVMLAEVEIPKEKPVLRGPALSPPFTVAPRVEKHFASFEWQSKRTQAAPVYGYRLAIAAEANSLRKFPLLMWMHGSGEGGNDNISQLRWLELIFRDDKPPPPIFILAVQASGPLWNKSEADLPEGSLPIAYEILEHVIKQYPIDEDRIVLAGISSGGDACWEMGCKHPDRFAAMAPMGSGSYLPHEAEKLWKLPIWAFHTDKDTAPSPDGARAMIAAVNGAGGTAHLTETPPFNGYIHDCWSAAFVDYNVLDWMLAQRRGAKIVWWPPGGKSAKQHVFDGINMSWPAVLLLGIAALVLYAKRRDQRRQALDALNVNWQGAIVMNLKNELESGGNNAGHS
jgi:predicted esterase